MLNRINSSFVKKEYVNDSNNSSNKIESNKRSFSIQYFYRFYFCYKLMSTRNINAFLGLFSVKRKRLLRFMDLYCEKLRSTPQFGTQNKNNDIWTSLKTCYQIWYSLNLRANRISRTTVFTIRLFILNYFFSNFKLED
jgi:hypothetical protein